MDAQISVIVPIYKTQKYLHKCVDSILAQTHRNLEVILVDDGSPDSCGTICDTYAQTDPRVVVIHKKNGGLSAARNAGMAVAKGRFLMFVDSDDLLPPDSVQTLLDLALSEDAELVIGAHDRFEETMPPPAKTSPSHQCLSSTEAMADMFRNGCSAWARLYRKEIHDGIPYPAGQINEDEAIMLQILERCDRIVQTEKIVYHYRCRPESITTAAFSPKKLAWKEHFAANLCYIRKHHPELEVGAAVRYRDSLLWSLTEIALSDDDFTPLIEELRQELRLNKKLFVKLPFRSRQEQIQLWLLSYLPFGAYRMIIRAKRKR